MTVLIADNNPNNVWGKHVIEVVFKQWKYEAIFTTRVGGNCHGLTLFESAISNIYDKLDRSIDGVAHMVMRKPDGGELLCQDDEERDEDWLQDMVVSCRIVDFEPPTLNEIRARNGRDPVPDGDKPYIALGSD